MESRAARLRRLAERQWGLVTSGQLRALGIDKSGVYRLVHNGVLERALPGVYKAWDVDDPRQHIFAAGLWVGEKGAVSHRSAAVWWGFDIPSTDVREVTVISKRKGPRGIVVRHHPLSNAERARCGPMFVTTPARTLLDLASVFPMNDLERAVHSAVRSKRCTLGRLASLCEKSAGRRGIQALRTLLEDVERSGITESPLEARVLGVLRRCSLPPPSRQHVITDRKDFVARVDFAYPSVRVAIEVDGLAFHSSREDLKRDHRRLNRLQALGWTVIFVSADELRCDASWVATLHGLVGQQRFPVESRA